VYIITQRINLISQEFRAAHPTYHSSSHSHLRKFYTNINISFHQTPQTPPGELQEGQGNSRRESPQILILNKPEDGNEIVIGVGRCIAEMGY